MKLIFATHNQHKVVEMQLAIGQTFELVSLSQAGIDTSIPEPHDTLEANASEKSWVIYKRYGTNCFSEDTGLETDALQGQPGVKSARYAGEEKSAAKNTDKLLHNLRGHANRKARFRTVISLIIDGSEQLFTGICEGTITRAPSGSGGFGYDAVFIPAGADRTFADMSMEEKTQYSHRKKAADQLVAFLQNIYLKK